MTTINDLRPANATRTRHGDGQTTDEYWLGHAEVMLINRALQDYANSLLACATAKRRLAAGYLPVLNDTARRTVDTLHEEAAQLEKDAEYANNFDRAVFQHRDRIQVHATNPVL